MTSWTSGEMMAVAAAAQITSDDVAIVGLGLPQVAAMLAKHTHASGARMLLEIGVFDPMPTESSMGIADPRMWVGAPAFAGMTDVLGMMLQGGRITLGMLGALQTDPAGTINSTLVKLPDGSTRRFNGSGGANDIASHAGRVMIVMKHDTRKFREAVDFATNPGRLVHGEPRDAVGLRGGGTSAIVTDRAVIEISARGASLAQIHPGEDLESVLADTPMTVSVPKGGPAWTSQPSKEQLALIREEVDPNGWFTK